VRAGDSVRIMAQLIEPETGQALWAESYERDFEDVLVLQGEVAQAIAGEVQVAVTPDEAERLAGARTVNPEAHDNYLKGSYHWKKQTPEDLDTAESYFELALEKDPSYAPAYEGLAWVWAIRQQLAITPPDEAGPKAKAAALRAIELDEGSAGAHAALALVKTLTDWDWEGAEPEWRRALELDPNSADAHAFVGYILAITGRTEEAVSHAERAIELDPFNALFHGLSATVLYFDRRYDDARPGLHGTGVQVQVTPSRQGHLNSSFIFLVGLVLMGGVIPERSGLRRWLPGRAFRGAPRRRWSGTRGSRRRRCGQRPWRGSPWRRQ